MTLTAGQTCDLRARFDPAGTAHKAATLTVTSSEPVLTVTLTGTGTQAVAVTHPGDAVLRAARRRRRPDRSAGLGDHEHRHRAGHALRDHAWRHRPGPVRAHHRRSGGLHDRDDAEQRRHVPASRAPRPGSDGREDGNAHGRLGLCPDQRRAVGHRHPNRAVSCTGQAVLRAAGQGRRPNRHADVDRHERRLRARHARCDHAWRHRSRPVQAADGRDDGLRRDNARRRRDLRPARALRSLLDRREDRHDHPRLERRCRRGHADRK